MAKFPLAICLMFILVVSSTVYEAQGGFLLRHYMRKFPRDSKDFEPFAFKGMLSFVDNLESMCPLKGEYKEFFVKLKAFMAFVNSASGSSSEFQSQLKAKSEELFKAITALGIKGGSSADTSKLVDSLVSMGKTLAEYKRSGSQTMTSEQRRELVKSMATWAQMIGQFVKNVGEKSGDGVNIDLASLLGGSNADSGSSGSGSSGSSSTKNGSTGDSESPSFDSSSPLVGAGSPSSSSGSPSADTGSPTDIGSSPSSPSSTGDGMASGRTPSGSPSDSSNQGASSMGGGNSDNGLSGGGSPSSGTLPTGPSGSPSDSSNQGESSMGGGSSDNGLSSGGSTGETENTADAGSGSPSSGTPSTGPSGSPSDSSNSGASSIGDGSTDETENTTDAGSGSPSGGTVAIGPSGSPSAVSADAGTQSTTDVSGGSQTYAGGKTYSDSTGGTTGESPASSPSGSTFAGGESSMSGGSSGQEIAASSSEGNSFAAGEGSGKATSGGSESFQGKIGSANYKGSVNYQKTHSKSSGQTYFTHSSEEKNSDNVEANS